MRPFLIFTILLVLAGMIPPAAGQQAPAEAPPVANPAIDFLAKVEARNEAVETLQAEFHQTRYDQLFDHLVESDGKFWYEATGRFRASYESEADSEIWMVDNKLIEYVPDIDQVSIVHQREGDEAPINQLLLGFGIEVERILARFEVRQLADGEEGRVAIEFLPRDPDLAMGYTRIVVHFDEETVEPRTIELEDEQNEVTVELKRVRLNAEINESVFEPKWDDDAEVLVYRE